jgi:hypothetical protein
MKERLAKDFRLTDGYCFLQVALLFFCVAAFSMFSCTSSDPQAQKLKNDSPYFDLKAFIDKELIRIGSLRKIKKITSINGITEEKTLDSVDFHKELQLFKDADINRASWIGKYEVDSTYNEDGNLISLKYSANTKDLRTRYLKIEYNGSSIKEIEILNSSYSAFTNSNQVLKYSPFKGYSIESKQGIRFTDNTQIKIEVLF